MAQVETPPSRPVATLDEVARVAGVSRATVSRVVNGSPKVSADVRRTVEKAIDRLGYVPNRAARSLVTRRSDSIAVVITEPASRLFNDPFFPRLVRGVSAALSVRDLQLVLLMPDDEVDEQRTVRYLTAGHVDGVILVSLHGDDPLPDQLANRRIPSVVLGRPPRGRRRGLRRRRQPRRRAARDEPPGRERPQADRDDHRPARHGGRHRPARRLSRRPRRRRDRHRRRPRSPLATSPRRAAKPRMERLLRDRPDLDAVFCASDLMAVAALGRAPGRRSSRSGRCRGRRLRRLARSPPPPDPRSRASVSRSRRWAARWSTSWPAASSATVASLATSSCPPN